MDILTSMETADRERIRNRVPSVTRGLCRAPVAYERLLPHRTRT
jgi:hypothetical protein